MHPTFLSHVLSGEKQLSLEQAAKISDQLGHTEFEQEYFFILIQLDRAGTQRLKKYWIQKKNELEKERNNLKNRFERHVELTDSQRMIVYSNLMYVSAWISTSIDGKQTLTQIANRLKIDRVRTEKIMRFLVETRLCAEKDGYYSLGEGHIHISNESPMVLRHHLNWRMKAVQQMDEPNDEELFFTAPMSISNADFKFFREKLNVLIEEIVSRAKASPAEEIVCLNIDCFKPFRPR